MNRALANAVEAAERLVQVHAERATRVEADSDGVIKHDTLLNSALDVVQDHPFTGGRVVDDVSAAQACYLGGLLDHLGMTGRATVLLSDLAERVRAPQERALLRNMAGILAVRSGNYDDAELAFRDALIDAGPADPAFADKVRANLAATNLRQGRLDEAVRWAKQSQLDPQAQQLRPGVAVLATSVLAATAQMRNAPPALLAEARDLAKITTLVGHGANGEAAALGAVERLAWVAFQANLGRQDLEKMRDSLAILEGLSLRVSAFLGPGHPRSVSLYANTATAELELARLERSEQATRISCEMLQMARQRAVAALGPTHPETTVVTANEALAKLELSRIAGSVRDLAVAVADLQIAARGMQESVGETHPQTVVVSANYAIAELELARAERSIERVRHAAGLFEDVERRAEIVLGNSHPVSIVIGRHLRVCNQLAANEPPNGGRGGVAVLAPPIAWEDADNWSHFGVDDYKTQHDAVGYATSRPPSSPTASQPLSDDEFSVRLARTDVEFMSRTYGPTSLQAFTARNDLAHWAGMAGDANGALQMYKELLSDQLSALTAEHAHVLRTRSNIAFWTARTGKVEEALKLYVDVLQDRRRLLGDHHPETLRTWHNMAAWAAESGDALNATKQLKAILEARRRVLGEQHEDTRSTEETLTFWLSRIAGPETRPE